MHKACIPLKLHTGLIMVHINDLSQLEDNPTESRVASFNVFKNKFSRLERLTVSILL